MKTPVTPLTYNDAVAIAASAVGHESEEEPCVCLECADVAEALLAVDVASREQERQATDHRCQSLHSAERCMLFRGHPEAMDHRNGMTRWNTPKEDQVGA